jgi:hypothetical protein
MFPEPYRSLGLIEARTRKPPTLHQSTWHPRRSRFGLIEASAPRDAANVHGRPEASLQTRTRDYRS